MAVSMLLRSSIRNWSFIFTSAMLPTITPSSSFESLSLSISVSNFACAIFSIVALASLTFWMIMFARLMNTTITKTITTIPRIASSTVTNFSNVSDFSMRSAACLSERLPTSPRAPEKFSEVMTLNPSL